MQKRLAPAGFRRARLGEHGVERHQLFRAHAGLVVRALRAIGAVLRAAAGLDRQQRRNLHLGGFEILPGARFARGTSVPGTADRTARAPRRASSRGGRQRRSPRPRLVARTLAAAESESPRVLSLCHSHASRVRRATVAWIGSNQNPCTGPGWNVALIHMTMQAGRPRKTMISRRAFALAACKIIRLAPLGPAAAQDWPTRPVTMVVPFPPGGGTDVLGRIVGRRLSEILGQQVIIENIGGAGGMIGSSARRQCGARRLRVRARQPGRRHQSDALQAPALQFQGRPCAGDPDRGSADGR